MVDTSEKEITQREASARAVVHLGKSIYDAVKENNVKKGDVLSVARIAGISAAKATPSLIPLCHTLGLSYVGIEFHLREVDHSVEVVSVVRCADRTGVEMEALTAVAVASLTVYDMCKAMSKDMEIREIRLLYKKGGKSN